MLTSGISISAALMIASRLELVGAEMDALLVLYCGFDEYSPAIMLVCGAKEDSEGRQLKGIFLYTKHCCMPDNFLSAITVKRVVVVDELSSRTMTCSRTSCTTDEAS